MIDKATLSTLTLLLVPLFSGCALLQPTDPYAPITARNDSAGDVLPMPTPASATNPAAIERRLTLSECIEIALANNPRIAQRYWDAAESAAQRDAAAGERWPAVSLQSGYRRNLDDQRLVGAREPGEPGTWSSDQLSTDLVIGMPLFTGGRIVNRIRATELLIRAAEDRIEVQTALANVQSSRERVRATETSTSQARESLRIEREKYDFGKGSITDVLDAQSALLEAETKHAQALAEHNVPVAQYRLAIGEE